MSLKRFRTALSHSLLQFFFKRSSYHCRRGRNLTQSALRLQSEASTIQMMETCCIQFLGCCILKPVLTSVLDLERLQWPQAKNTPLETNTRAKQQASQILPFLHLLAHESNTALRDPHVETIETIPQIAKKP
ncbi:hypothetical protein VNO77_18852 [Canavalia gladiata]|uniref:Uncharacterized protein n=1 Tax=Canavalia gladiata TaxID=3824 RepID=A0AAN9LQ99_CANGL